MRTYASIVAKNPLPFNPEWTIGKVFPTKPVEQPAVKKTSTVETVSSPPYIEEWRIPFFQQKGMTPINP
jgi:hypothetical protein